MREIIFNTVADLCLDFTDSDRIDDEELTSLQLKESIVSGEVTIPEILKMFEYCLLDFINS